ncbi:MAG TPA: hypothetical protein VFQ65_03200 [Kofleriaceae bacterium]|nr:hypothetical protein [Kofleriaceae bacterium]
MKMSQGVASFVITVGIAVPTAWHVLDASVERDGKKFRPAQKSFTVDGTRIPLDVDRSLVATGDTVTATLHAIGPAKQVVVDLDLLQSNNYAGERVEIPPTQIDHEKLVLTALPDGGPAVTTQLQLGKRPHKRALTDSFMVYVTSHGHHAEKREYDSPGKVPDYAGDVEAGNAAALSIMGWSGNSMAVKVVAEEPPSSTGPFKIAVHMKNTTGRDLKAMPYATVGTFVNDGGYLGTDADAFTIDQLDDESDKTWTEEGMVGLARGKEAVERFLITPHDPAAKQLTLAVEAESFDDQPGPVTAGAMDVVTFPLSHEPAPAVADKSGERPARSTAEGGAKVNEQP